MSWLWQRLNKTGSAQDCLWNCRQRFTTPGQDRNIWVFHLYNGIVTSTTTDSRITGLRRMSAQAVRNMFRQRGTRSRRAYVGPDLIQVLHGSSVSYIEVWTWGTGPEFRSVMNHISSLTLWWMNPRLNASKWEFRPSLRTWSWQIWWWKRRDNRSNILQPQNKLSPCPRTFNGLTL